MKKRIGNISITNVVEQDLHKLELLIPEAQPDAVKGIEWLHGGPFTDADGNMLGIVQAFVIECEGKTLVVDPCIGDDKSIPVDEALANASTGFLDRFRAAGFDPEQVDFVLCTHMHFDHVGWNTYRDGDEWKPTFPNAEYLFARAEMEFWQQANEVPIPALEAAESEVEAVTILFQHTQVAVHNQSIKPVLDAGLATIVSAPCEVIPGVSLFPTPGHTPGHVSIALQSEGEAAIITGDCFHHPCQIAKPDWATIVDFDEKEGVATRKRVLSDIVDSGAVLVGTHFCEPCCGTVVTDGASYRLDYD